MGFKGWKQALQDLWLTPPSFEQHVKHLLGVLNLGVAHEHLRNIQGAIQSYEVYSRAFQNDGFSIRLGIVGTGQWLQAA